MNNQPKIHLLGLALTVALLAGCAATPKQPQSLDQRVTAKWELLVAGEYAQAFEYYSPGFRSVNSVQGFVRAMSSRTIPWLGARLRDSGPCEPETCAVRVELDYKIQPRVPGAVPFESTKIIHENWILENNQWFYVPKQ